MKLQFEVDGTVEEIRNLLEGTVLPPLPAPARTIAGGSPAPDGNDEETRRFVSTEFARRVLDRRRLPKNSVAVLFVLCRAPYNEFVTYAHIKESAGLSEWEFRGVKGGFAKRISGTAGYERGAIFFEYDYGRVEEERKMRLPASVRTALQEKFPELAAAEPERQAQSKSNRSAKQVRLPAAE